MIHHKIGVVERKDGSNFITTASGEVGYAAFGPYAPLPQGRYVVSFLLTPLAIVPDDTVCCVIDVVANASDVLFQRTLRYCDIKTAPHSIDAEFSVPLSKANIEFRVYSRGSVPLSVLYDMPVKLLSSADGDADGFTLFCDPAENKFFNDNFKSFLSMRASDVAVAVHKTHVVGTYDNISFLLESPEDFQIVYEVFIINEYRFITQRTQVVMDIGMNVGLTSLFVSNLDSVKEVYSYEPFAAPFQRALRNFELNKDIACKIIPHQFGLGMDEQDLHVKSLENATIGTSVLGLGHGKAEVITIKDAAPEVRRVAERAKELGADLVVKVDCEGSEFAIFETLEKNGLFASVDIFMIEWHKWWSAEKTQYDLIRPLLNNHFKVFDHTSRTNPHAGMLYAVRTS